MKPQILAAAALAVTALATPVLAATPDATSDVHCYIIFSQMGASDDAVIRTAGTIGGLYFMGRLDAIAGLDVETTVLAELPKLKGDLLNAEAKRCGQEMQLRGAAASAMSDDLQKKRIALLEQERNSR